MADEGDVDPSITKVRSWIGNSISSEYITDDSISDCLTLASGNTLLAAAFCCEKIAGELMYLPDKSIEGSSVSQGQLAEALFKRATQLRTLAANSSLTPKASHAPVRRPDLFRVGQHDFRHHYYPSHAGGWP